MRTNSLSTMIAPVTGLPPSRLGRDAGSAVGLITGWAVPKEIPVSRIACVEHDLLGIHARAHPDLIARVGRREGLRDGVELCRLALEGIEAVVVDVQDVGPGRAHESPRQEVRRRPGCGTSRSSKPPH